MSRRLPGDLTAEEERRRMVRVDHAGEYGARRIYEGQLAVLGRARAGRAIKAMAQQETRHLRRFEAMVAERRVRPTALLPLWHLAGFALGAATAALGEKAAMACTIAVEEVIDEHYARQRDRLEGSDPELAAVVEEFRREEVEHKEIAEAAGGREAPGYELLSGAIKLGSRLAIWLSERA